LVFLIKYPNFLFNPGLTRRADSAGGPRGFTRGSGLLEPRGGE
jgi:hypothetical protein